MGISNHEQFPVSLNSQEADETLIATNSNLSIGSLTRRQSEKLEAATSTKEVLDEKNVEVASPEVQSSTTYPEGGVRAWSTIFGACVEDWNIGISNHSKILITCIDS